VLERFHHDHHRGDTGLLDCSCNVSDRHVTDGSHRDEEHQIDVQVMEPLHPIGKSLAEPTL
jgi:hypothetical protein